MKWIALALALALAALWLSVGAEAASVQPRATWKVRDAAAESAWTEADAAATKLALKLEPVTEGDGSRCTVVDTSGQERAVTLAFCLSVEAAGGTWWDDPQRSRTIEAGGRYANLSDRAGGVEDQASLYPLAVVTPRGADRATCLAAPPDEPRMVLFVYDARTKELRAEFDFGLSPVPEKFPSRADAKVIAFDVPAKWAFRQALAMYYKLFPDCFRRRVKSAGLWLPFGETDSIENVRDFGFAFHEIADHQAVPRILADDEKIGCGSFVYVEPQTYWQDYRGGGSGTYDQRRAQLVEEANSGSAVARGTIVSGVLRADGKRDLYLGGVAYTALRPWGNNCDPAIRDANKSRNWPGKGQYENDRLEPLLGLRGDKPNPGVDGVYVDSMEGWGERLDYDHEHWRVTSFPLTFEPGTKKVALLNFWGTVAWVKRMSQTLHAHGMPLFGNDAFFRRWQLAAYVDVPGREYTWVGKDGKRTPVEDERYLCVARTG
jgi:hypothetical protein